MRNKEGIYFITFATVGWVDVFTRMLYKDIFVDSVKYCQEEKGLIVYSWCLMSNHVHMIVRSASGDLSGTIRDLKKFTAKKIITEIDHHEAESRREWILSIFRRAGEGNGDNQMFQFWRQDNHPVELFSNAVVSQKLNYIPNNPVEAGIVENEVEYLYSSARGYAGISGLIDIMYLD